MNNNDLQILLNLFQELTYIDNVSGTLKALIRSVWQDIPTQIDKNGFFGQIQGPFTANQNLMSLIKQQCNEKEGNEDDIYISKIGIYYPRLPKIQQQKFNPIIAINGNNFAIGQTNILELNETYITSLKILQNVDSTFFIDYQYEKI